jgi:hypothetical protein
MVAGTAVADAAPFVAEAVEPWLAAGIAAAAVEPPAEVAGTAAEAAESAGAEPSEAVVRASGIAAAAVRQAAPDGPAVPPVLTEQQLQAAEILAAPTAAQGQAGRLDPGRADQDGYLVRAAAPSRRVSVSASVRRWAADECPAAHPVRLPEFAPAAHCLDEGYPAGDSLPAGPHPDHPAGRCPEERRVVAPPCLGGSDSPGAWPTAASPARTQDASSPRRPVHPAAPA